MKREQIIQMARPKPIPSANGYFVDAFGNVYNHRGKKLSQQITKKVIVELACRYLVKQNLNLFILLLPKYLLEKDQLECKLGILMVTS